MEIRQMRYFLAVADARSFVGAAEKLFISRQAISKSVAQLEEELNVELFMRDSNGAFLTPAGVMFYERVRTLVTELDSVRTQMQTYGVRYHQRVRIAFAIGTVGLFEEQLLQYRKKQYNADITYTEETEGDCLRLLTEHEADVMVTTQPPQDSLFITKPLLTSPLGILTYEDMTEPDLKELAQMTLAGQNDGRIPVFCKENGLTLAYKGHDTRRLMALAKAGKCVLLIPQCLLFEVPEGMRWLPLGEDHVWQLYVSYPRNTQRNLMFSAAMDDMYKRVFIPAAAGEEEL